MNFIKNLNSVRLLERWVNNLGIGNRLVRGVFWSMIGSVISRGLMMVATIIVARILGKSGYGEFGIIQSTVDLFGVFAGFGLGLTATKHVAEFRNTDSDRAGRILGLSRIVALVTGLTMAIILFSSAPWLAEHSINAPQLAPILRIGSLILLINALNGAQTGALAGFEAFKSIAKVNALVGILSFPLLTLGAWIWGVEGTVWALVLNLTINWALNNRALKKESKRFGVPYSFSGSKRELPILWKFSLPATLSGMMVGPANWICRAMLTNQPDGYNEMGTLTAALIFQGLLMFVSNMLGAPLLSMVSNEGERISDSLGSINILSSWILGVFVAIPLLCFPEVVQLLLGPDYTNRSFQVTFSLVVFSTSIVTFKAGLARVLAANNLLWWGFLSNSLWAVVLIVSTTTFIDLGAIGLGIALAIAYSVNTIVIIPLYYYRNLVPKGTLFSKESLIIWSILVILLLVNITEISKYIRFGIFIPAFVLVFLSFKNLYKYSNINQNPSL